MAFRLTMWRGSAVRLQEASNFIVTIMGGTEILLLTLAEKILYLKKAQAEWGSVADVPARRVTVITIMGATELKRPTIAQEIEDMVKLRQSGILSETELAASGTRRSNAMTMMCGQTMGWVLGHFSYQPSF